MHRSLIILRRPGVYQFCNTGVASDGRHAKRGYANWSFGGFSARQHQQNSSIMTPIRRCEVATNTTPSAVNQSRDSAFGGANGVLHESFLSQTGKSYGQQPRARKSLVARDLIGLLEAVKHVSRLFSAHQGIPSECTTLNALSSIAQAHIEQIIAVQSQSKISWQQSHSASTANHLLALDENSQGSASVSENVRQDVTALATNVIERMSEVAYAIVSHRAVVITPRILAEYVKIQTRLGKPEALPHVLTLYASKPRPWLKDGAVLYKTRNPVKAENAIPIEIAELALDAAIAAGKLDAAVNIVEATYATKAFVRSRVLRYAVLPGVGLVMLGPAAYGIATGLARLQSSMDTETAVNVAFLGLATYLGSLATLGIVVITTYNDQMKRVTWLPGTPLRQRWMREKERAALDKVACSFGFSEEHRFGEEEGAEFDGLREYLLQKGMVLDAVELMKGMQ